ncbi:MAG: TRAP transporter small permease subunit [Desulfarculus sp.]|nr:TRAP transporter small permease subunit [Desulfarculus sp.]
MQKIIQGIGKVNVWLGYLVAPITLILTALVFYEVVLRYFLSTSSSWSAEVQNYLQIALVMLGGGYTLFHGGHVRVDVLHRGFGPRTKAIVDLVTAITVLVFAGPMVWHGAILTWEALESGQTSVSAAELILWPSMATVPLGVACLALQAVAGALSAFLRLGSGAGGEAGHAH